MLHTSLGSEPLNFTLQATIPAHALALCAATLPRPLWEPLLYYAAVLSMGFLLFGVLVAAYFEADRISVADIIRRRAEVSHATTMFEKGRMFDLRAISRGGTISPSVCEGDEVLKNGSSASSLSTLSMNSAHKSRSTATSATTNGHVSLSNMLSSGDGQRSGRSALRFFEQLWASRSRTPSAPKSPSNEPAGWTIDRKSGTVNASASVSSRRWNPVWLGVAALGAVFRQVHQLSVKLTCPSSAAAVSTKSTSTGDDSPGCAAESWPDHRLSATSSCESVPSADGDDHDCVMASKSDNKSLHLRREKSTNDQLSSTSSYEPLSKTGLCYAHLCMKSNTDTYYALGELVHLGLIA